VFSVCGLEFSGKGLWFWAYGLVIEHLPLKLELHDYHSRFLI
jgi:hypothetical protein